MGNSGFSQFDKGPGRPRKSSNKINERQHDHKIVSELLIGQPYTISGEGDDIEKRNYIYIGNAANILREQDDDDFDSKAFATLDVLIRPISKQGRGNLPRYFNLGNSTGCDLHAPSLAQPPIYFRSGEQYVHPITLTESDPYKSGHDFEVLGRDLSEDPSGHISFTVEELNGLNPYTDDISTFALKGPIVMVGPGYDINGKPIPNSADNEEDASSGIFTHSCLTDQFLEGYLKKSHTHPVGIVDLRFDRKRGMWVSPPPYKLIKAKLIEELAPFQTASAYQVTGEYIFDESGYSIPFDNRNSISVRDYIGMRIPADTNLIVYYDTDTCTYIPISTGSIYDTPEAVESGESTVTGVDEEDDNGYADNTCSGYCIFEWSVIGNGGEWNLLDSTCMYLSGTTTTTTTTTTAEPTGDERPELICIDPEEPQNTTSTTSTSTTTEEPTGCTCLKPNFCGETDGETTRTLCYPTGYDNSDPYCPTGTTTECPTGEDTGTTTEDPECSGCIWWWANGVAHALESRCNGVWGAPVWGPNPQEGDVTCYCSLDIPNNPPDAGCGFGNIPCEYATYHTTTIEPFCGGTCFWIGYIFEDTSGWIFGGPPNPCTCYISCPCNCYAPSYPPAHGICEYTTTPCISQNTSSTTIDPCDTPEPCEDYCKFISLVEGSWGRYYNPCEPDCPCASPEYPPISIGETARVQCGTGRTTTTTTSTTTTNEPETCACCNVPADSCTENMAIGDCERYGGICKDACADCFPVIGACCRPNGTCFITQEVNCISPNEWLGITGYNACSGDPCELGACCNGATCTYVREDQCGGDWYPDEDCDTVGLCTSTTTTTTTTEEPTGSCCYGIEGQLCLDGVTVAECDNVFGTWSADDCATRNCETEECGTCTYAANGSRTAYNCSDPCACPSHIVGNGSVQIINCA